MKSKLYLLVILLIIFMPVKIFAMEYIAEITGSDVIYSKSDNENINQRMKSSISIDVSNLYNISYLELTSNKKRCAAHKLYQKNNFKIIETDLFRKEIN